MRRAIACAPIRENRLDLRLSRKLETQDHTPNRERLPRSVKGCGEPLRAVQAENSELTPLSSIEPGSGATIVRLAEHDGDLLHWFYDEGFVPGTQVELQEAQPAAGQLKVRLNGADRAIAERAAAGLYVRATA